MAAKGPLERYEELGIGESLPRVYQYPIACRELSLILRSAYSKLSKNLQSLIFRDTLSAFHLLPQIQTQSAVSAANLLMQSADAVLPKQKRVLAATEFKHAKVAHKRRCKDRQEEGLSQLPPDVLVHIFSFLDLPSLLSAASVCWLWNSAASDNHLWHLQYTTYFGNSSNKDWRPESCGMRENDEHQQFEGDSNIGTSIDWRDTFKKASEGHSSKTFIYYRGYCGQCSAVVWLSNMKCCNQPCKLNSGNQQIKPVSPEQIVEYISNGTLSVMYSSESDSDSDGEHISKLWAIPRHLGNQF
ncbi:F-box protein At5g52880 isoform X2 [Diospyros lotus]|uniref:F-box protein At5g52880 isoform X2 n=1 Tax=Diospyros lotus TaxID=55363 RepID=UPI00225872C2|nr:F-box protein At5g52880 isoform X2 [Diospyros lotus]XP_052176327.1 F-box protein At5g52880 isoform X2 [Diospyros lotus]